MPKTKSNKTSSNFNSDELAFLVKRRENIFFIANYILKRSESVTEETAVQFQEQLNNLEKLEKDFEHIQAQITWANCNSFVDDSVDVDQAALNFYDLCWRIRANVPITQPDSQNTMVVAAPSENASLAVAPVQTPPPDGTNAVILADGNHSGAYEGSNSQYLSPSSTANRYLSDLLNLSNWGTEENYLSVHEKVVSALKAMKLPPQPKLADYVLFRNRYEDLGLRIKYLFDDRFDLSNVPTCLELFDFVLYFNRMAELRSKEQSSTSEPAPKFPPQVKGKTRKSFLSRKAYAQESSHNQGRRISRLKCPVCSKHHYIYTCIRFLKMKVQERLNTINRLGRCLNCLGAHSIQQCTSKKTCKKCGQQHHSFLHSRKPDQSSVVDAASSNGV